MASNSIERAPEGVQFVEVLLVEVDDCSFDIVDYL